MSVKALSQREAIELVDECNRTGKHVTNNFHQVFGTNGCLLKCESESIEQKSMRIRRWKSPSGSSQGNSQLGYNQEMKLLRDQTWFSAKDLTSSAAQGCGSCKVLRQIFLKLFFGNAQDLSNDHEYSVSQHFELRYRFKGNDNSVIIARLFQPPESRVHFQRMPTSEFLLGKEKSIARLRQWLGDCLSNHELCSKQNAAQKSRPTRLLDVKSMFRMDRPGVRLIHTKTACSYQYACLSHRWDDAVLQCRTTTNNISDNMEFVDFKELPTNFRDAIMIARHLSIDYLWIDSLCIIQDNGEDLLKEMAKMCSIYQSALLTIAAISSPTSSGGCFLNDKWPDTCFLATSTAEDSYILGSRVLDGKGQAVLKEEIDEHYPLFTRGWVFQERLLSTRIVQCNYGEFAFECLEKAQCECMSSIAPHTSSRGANQSRNLTFTPKRHLLSQQVENQDRSLEYWKTVVGTYMTHSLTCQSDILPAIAGCAQLLSSNLGLTYVAGLWEEHLTTGLLWHVKQGRSVKLARPDDSTSPSWSWASVAMSQSIQHIEGYKAGWTTSDLLLRNAISEIHCKPQSATNPFGKVESAYLKFGAVLYPWYIRKICTTAKFERPANERYSTRDLHTKRHTNKLYCTTQTQELTMDHAEVEVMFDVHLGSEGLMEERFTHCQNPAPPYCTLSKIYLLPAVHKKGHPRALDVLLVLMRIPSVDGKPNCYRRIGLIKVLNVGADKQTWKEVIEDRSESLWQEFWLF